VTGFNDLIPRAQPAIVGGGAQASATEGADWEWRFTDLVDNAGTAINLSSATGTCTIYDGSSSVTTLTFTGTTGGFTLSKAASDTAGLAGSLRVRRCRWSLVVTLSGKKVQFWTPDKSGFAIRSVDGVAA
jgi:hypothetical protein